VDTIATAKTAAASYDLFPKAASNDNLHLGSRGACLPDDAFARIYRPSRSAMTSGMGCTKWWRLVFEPRFPPFTEPLMGWTGSRDPLAQVELRFPTLESALAYARREGLRYVVHTPATSADLDRVLTSERKQSFSDTMMDRLALPSLQAKYGQAMQQEDSPEANAARAEMSPMDVVNHPGLSQDEKRSLLVKWAWDEFLVEQSRAGGGSDGHASRLNEVEQAILALEGRTAAAPAGSPATQRAL